MVDDGADPFIVVTDKDRTLTARGLRQLVEYGIGGANDTGQHDVKGGAGAEVALCPDGTTMLLHDAATDGEAETGAPLLAGIGGLYLLKAIEDSVELVGGDTASLVRHLEEDGVGGGFGKDAYGGGGRLS